MSGWLSEWLRPRARAVVRVIDVARFGRRRSWKEVQEVLKGARGSTLFDTLGQILVFQRQRCQEAVEMKSNLPNGQAQFEAGGAASAADVLDLLQQLAEGKCRDQELAAWFGESEKEG